jgi:site-specific recombinase XerD
VKSNTSKDYNRYIRRWEEYLTTKGYIQAPNFPFLDALTEVQKKTLLICFMDKESKEGHDYSKAMTAVRSYFRDNLRDVKMFEDESIRSVRRALTPSSRELSLQRAKHFRLPTPFEFIVWARKVYWEIGDIDHRMVYLAVAISYNYGLRSSEYCHDDQNKGLHAFRADDVFFVNCFGQRHLPWQVSANVIKDSDVQSAKIDLRSSKNIKNGVGRQLFLSRVSSAEEQLLCDMLQWCRDSAVKSGDIFFCRYLNGKRKQLIPKMVNECLKAAATNFGLPTSMFSTHCNRIGCATDLASDGLHDSDLKKFVGWKSDSSLLYQHGSSKDPSALRSGASGNGLSLAEVANLIPVSRSEEIATVPSRKSRMRATDSLRALDRPRAVILMRGEASFGK